MVPQKRTSRSTLSGQTRRSRRPTGRRRGGPWGACFACLAAGLLASASAGCSSADSAATHHDGHSGHKEAAASHRFEGEYPIQIVTTVGQVAEMMKRIGGEHVEVTALMGPGIDPHLYKPLPKDVSAMSGADAIFYVGMHLEGRMTEIFERMARQRLTYPVTAGLQSRGDDRLRKPAEFAGVYDPHVWHDVAIWMDCVHDAAAALADFDPEHADDYRANAAEYEKELVELDKYVRAAVATIPEQRRMLVTAHDAFGYFGASYGIEVHGLKGVSSEDEIDLAHHEQLQELLVGRKIPAVFVESSIAPRSIESLIETCRAAGHEVSLGGELYADVLAEKGEPGETYAGMIRHNVDTIVAALNGQ